MKTSLFKRLTAFLLCMLMLLAIVACTPGDASPKVTEPENQEPQFPENGTMKIVSQERKIYVTADVVDDIVLAHYESTPEILFIDVETARAEFFDDFLSIYGTYVIEETDTTLKITRDNGAYCLMDFVKDTLYFNDFDMFCAKRTDTMSDRLAEVYLDAQGNAFYFQRVSSMDIAGLPVYIDLAARSIPLEIYEGKKYIPFQTFNDLFISPYGHNFLFNTKDIFLSSSGAISPDLEQEYYSIPTTERSQALIDFTYNEFCLAMDLYYGLQEEQGVVNGFDEFFERSGISDEMLSADAATANTALVALTYGYLPDLHSNMKKTSPYTGSAGLNASGATVAPSYDQVIQYAQKLAMARATAMPDGVPAYQEIGNTAYISLDSFTISSARFAGYSEDAMAIGDTLGLVMYAHSRITAEDSQIENVVLDLSCNSGGQYDAAVYVAAWLLGSCNINLANSVTESYSTSTVKVDVNLDGKFDEKDSIADKNLFCIVSRFSFSCGNLVPSILKASGNVTLIGDTSGGGACEVQHLSMADGTVIDISGPRAFCEVANGSYQDIDRGVEPHFYLTKLSSFFDREALTAYINSLK